MDIGGNEFSPPNPENPQERRPRVLIVEDDEVVQMLLEATLQGKAEILGVFDRAEDVEKWFGDRSESDSSPDLTITDLGLLDGKDAGFRVVEAVRQKYPNCEIDMLTGRAGQLLSQDTQARGITNVVAKPFSPSKYSERIASLTQKINSPQPPFAK